MVIVRDREECKAVELEELLPLLVCSGEGKEGWDGEGVISGFKW
jgi:hypothetical protein